MIYYKTSNQAKTIYFDESGFTGNNLLDNSQPIFAVASTDIQEEVAEEILKSSFPNYQGREFKFQNIWKSSKGRRDLIAFAKALDKLGNRSYVWMTDKKFCVLTKIVDFLIEPVIHNAGYDFYSDGFCWKYTNYIYFGFSQFTKPDVLDSILYAYQKFSRNPSSSELKKLQGFLNRLSKSINNETTIFLEQMALGARLFEKYHNLDDFKGTDEIQFTTMLAIIGHWRQNFVEDFIVVHDASSNFSRKKSMWEKITNCEVPKQEHRLGDGSIVEFPLRLIETNPIDSKDCYSVQFCDVLAGLVTKYFTNYPGCEYESLMNEIVENGLKSITYNGIRFQPEFPDKIPPDTLKGPDIVDRITKIMTR